jgi:hypothetical protein
MNGHRRRIKSTERQMRREAEMHDFIMPDEEAEVEESGSWRSKEIEE